MKPIFGILLIVLALGVIGASQALFTVDQREQAIVLQLGQPVGAVKGPGLHWKIPVIQDVRRFDSRILSVDPEPEQMVISSDKQSPLVTGGQAEPTENEEAKKTVTAMMGDDNGGEPIIVDTFARYRIVDPLMFMKTLRTVYAANQRLESIMNDATRGVLGNTTLRELLSAERGDIMADIRNRVNKKITDDALGIELIDIRIVRADLTTDLRTSTVRRMISSLKERATETRAKGEEMALQIRSTAEKERTVILAESQRDSQIIRGEGDQVAIKTYAAAFNKDKEFYGFVRSMEAYKKTMANPETRLILSPDSAFFKYFKGE